MSKYLPTIGIEVHIELKTNSKVFSDTKNDYNSEANTNICEIDLGYPGTLPTVNEEVVRKAIKSGLALNCTINKKMHFDRKNYFYPDLPKGYQITQAKTPIAENGYIEIKDKKIRIERIHIEEDTAKSLHKKDKTYLNYNRAGVPLIEIVSKPDMHTKEEAMAYLERLRETLFYLGVSDCKIEEGSMRADVNISISDTDTLGTRAEIKNIGSIKNVGLAIDYEIKRQEKLLENKEKVEEDTRKFDATTNTTILMRKKETGNDYRYFEEPDIPYLTIEDTLIEEIRQNIKLLPDERRQIYKQRNILDINIEKLINDKELSDYLNQFIDTKVNFKIASNILLSDIKSYLNKNRISIFDTKLTKEKFIELTTLLEEKTITNQIFKDIINDILEQDLSLKEILKQKNISLEKDLTLLEEIIKNVLKENEKSVNDYKNGKDNALKYLMGMVMKQTKGTYNPKDVNQTLISLLSKSVNWLLLKYNV